MVNYSCCVIVALKVQSKKTDTTLQQKSKLKPHKHCLCAQKVPASTTKHATDPQPRTTANWRLVFFFFTSVTAFTFSAHLCRVDLRLVHSSLNKFNNANKCVKNEVQNTVCFLFRFYCFTFFKNHEKEVQHYLQSIVMSHNKGSDIGVCHILWKLANHVKKRTVNALCINNAIDI